MSFRGKSKINLREVNHQFTNVSHATFKNNASKESLFLSHKQLSEINKANEAEYDSTFYKDILAKINDNEFIDSKFEPMTPSSKTRKERKFFKENPQIKKIKRSSRFVKTVSTDNNIHHSQKVDSNMISKERISISKENHKELQVQTKKEESGCKIADFQKMFNSNELDQLSKRNSHCLFSRKMVKQIQNVAQIQLNSIKEEKTNIKNALSTQINTLINNNTNNIIVQNINNNIKDSEEDNKNNKTDVLILNDNLSNIKQLNSLLEEDNNEKYLNKIIEKQEEEQQEEKDQEREKNLKIEKSSNSKQSIIILKKKKLLLFCCFPLN